MKSNLPKSKPHFVSKLNTKYKISKNKHLNVTSVMDDGRFTYIVMDNPQYKPTVFLVPSHKKKHLEPVRFFEKESTYMVHCVLEKGEKFLLKIGKKYTLIQKGRP